MNRKVPPRVQFQYEPDLKPVAVDDEVEEFESYEEEVGEPPAVIERMPEVVGKEEIVGESIFEYPDNIAVMPDEVKENLKYEGMEDGIDYMENIKEPSKPRIKSPAPAPAPEPKKTKSGRKPRKPMTQEQKDKLAQARVKAVQVKKAKAEERKRQKELEMEEKELLKQRKAKNLQKLREEVSESPKPEAKVVHQQVTGLTRKDLEEAQYEAISKYEILRKQRKEEKRKLMAQEKQKRELIEKLKPDNNGYRARDANGKLKNRWDMCY